MLSVSNLSRSFGGRRILNLISFVVNTGERIGLIGPNGAGKSTLLRLVAGLDVPDTGSVSLSPGERIGVLRQGFADLSDLKLREGVPKVTSKDVLFDWVRLVDDEGKPSDVFFEGDSLRIELGLSSTIDSRRLEALCFVRSLEGILVFTLTSGLLDVELQPGSAELSVTIPRNQLRSGRYTLDLYLLTAQPQDYLLGAKTFEVVVSREPGGDPRRVRDNLGLVTVEQEWGQLRQATPDRV